ncbi:MAG: hypothetical protein ACE15C_04915 [Phycisphaerae bacterium]
MPSHGKEADARRARLVRANIAATHANQILMARKAGKSDLAGYQSALSDEALGELVKHQEALLATDLPAVAAWVKGTSRKKPAVAPAPVERYIEPLLAAPIELRQDLPVNVFAAYLAKAVKAPPHAIEAVASLYQLVLEIHRDGTTLQKLFDFYIAAGLPVYIGQLGLRGTDADMLRAGRKLAPRTCPSPFDTSAPAWQIAGRKVWNWGQKKLHIRDDKVLARELLLSKDIRPLTAKLRAMPAQRIAIIGHSFTNDMHFCSPSSFTQIVAAIFGRVNPGVEFRHWTYGSMTATQAREMFFQEVTLWKPAKVFLFVLLPTDADKAAMRKMAADFAAAGAETWVFPHNGPRPYNNVKEVREFAKAGGIRLADFVDAVDACPDKDKFVCLDGVHMTEPYHVAMAKELLKLLASP